MSADCVFCKIVSGELPSFKIYEDEHTIAFLDIHPVNPGHILVIPKVHSPNIFDVSREDWLAVCDTAHMLAPVMERVLASDGVNVMMNNREHAGQVIHHAHVHLIPRYKGDGLKLWPHKSYKEGDADELKEKIRAAL